MDLGSKIDVERGTPLPDPNAELVWILGQPHLCDFLHFVRTKTIDGEHIDPRQLTDQWRKANDIYFDLENSEAGAADGIETWPLPEAMQPLAEKVRQNPYFRYAFDSLPTSIEMIDLEKLIVSQTHVANVFSDLRAACLGDDISDTDLFAFCQPLEPELPDVQVRRISSKRYLFTSFSTDLRAHEPVFLKPEQYRDSANTGPVAAMIGLGIGFGSNFMSGIRSEGRIVLHNGHHRAYSLYAKGIRKAPCIIEDVTRLDELSLAAGDELSERPAFYFRGKRPPLLRDYFDARLTTTLQVRPIETAVEIEWKARSYVCTDMSETLTPLVRKQ